MLPFIKNIKFSILILSFFIFTSTAAYAGLSVSPSITNVFGEPGLVYEGKYKVKNTNDYPITLVYEIEEGNSYSGNGDIKGSSWLKFEKEKYPVNAGESVEVPYKVEISTAFKGSVSARVTFSAAREAGRMINIMMTVPIYVTVVGTENVDFCIDEIKLTAGKGGIGSNITIENKGNVHIRHTGTIELYTKNKKKLVKTVAMQESYPTYCEYKRSFQYNVCNANELKKGQYVAVFKVTALNKEAVKEVKFKVVKTGDNFAIKING